MATWRIWPSTNGDVVASDTTSNSLSTEFAVTQAGCSITGYWWWCPVSGDTAAKTFTLWSVTTGTTGTQITAANATSGTNIAGAWNFTACTPTALTANQHYRTEVTFAVTTSSWYSGTANYWTAGGGASNIVNGPLTGFSNANATGNVQGGFITGTSPAFTTAQSSAAVYWIDVQVDDGVAAASPGQAGRTPPGRQSPAAWSQLRVPATPQPPPAPPPPPATGSSPLVPPGRQRRRPVRPGAPPGAASPRRRGHSCECRPPRSLPRRRPRRRQRAVPPWFPRGASRRWRSRGSRCHSRHPRHPRHRSPRPRS